jgi:sacsin
VIAYQLAKISEKFLKLQKLYDIQLQSEFGVLMTASIEDINLEDNNTDMIADNTANDYKIDLQVIKETVSTVIPLLYQRLNSITTENEKNTIRRILDASYWIWVGDTFVHPSKVAFSSVVNVSPYLRIIPQDLAVYKKMLYIFNIKDQFNSRDFVEVLRQMAIETNAFVDPSIKSSVKDEPTKNGVKTVNSAFAKCKVLSDSQIDFAVSLVTQLSSEGAGGSGAASFRPHDHVIYIPDHTGRLAPATDLVCDDVPWLNGTEFVSARSGLRLSHPHIAGKVAQHMGVKSLRLLLVHNSVETIFSDTEAFGQAESLTSRLRTILDMYPGIRNYICIYINITL